MDFGPIPRSAFEKGNVVLAFPPNSDDAAHAPVCDRSVAKHKRISLSGSATYRRAQLSKQKFVSLLARAKEARRDKGAGDLETGGGGG